MKYAVIKTGGKQYRVSEGDIIEIDRLAAELDHQVEFDKILLFVADDTVKIGKPNLTDVSVKGKVLEQIKGKKIRVAKFKAKARYRRVTGFRSQLTSVKIDKVELKKSKST